MEKSRNTLTNSVTDAVEKVADAVNRLVKVNEEMLHAYERDVEREKDDQD